MLDLENIAKLTTRDDNYVVDLSKGLTLTIYKYDNHNQLVPWVEIPRPRKNTRNEVLKTLRAFDTFLKAQAALAAHETGVKYLVPKDEWQARFARRVLANKPEDGRGRKYKWGEEPAPTASKKKKTKKAKW